jgi:hypothetical protein
VVFNLENSVAAQFLKADDWRQEKPLARVGSIFPATLASGKVGQKSRERKIAAAKKPFSSAAGSIARRGIAERPALQRDAGSTLYTYVLIRTLPAATQPCRVSGV